MTALELERIIEGCKRNDRVAQKQLYSIFYPYTMHVCLPYTKTQDESEDVLCEAFIRIFKSIGQYDLSKGSLYAWIRKIVINKALDHLKQKSKFKTSCVLEYAEELVIENNVLEKISANELLLLIRELPPATQAVLNLYCIEGYNHGEIASLLEISEGTSKWHLSEARKQLKERLQKVKIYG
jgi:RNA polymerase sigma factor (sigma-70 family)